MSERLRRAAVSTFVVDHPADRVFQTLIDPLAVRWIIAQCAYAAAAPGPTDEPGALRCCWLDRVRGGVRQVAVVELETAQPNELVRYIDRSAPGSARSTTEFRLTAQGGATLVELTAPAGRHGRTLEAGLNAALSGSIPRPVNPQIVTLVPGAGAKKQVHEVVISGSPKRVWKTLEDAASPFELDGSEPLVTWQSHLGELEFDYCISRTTHRSLGAIVIRVIPHGPFHVTTIDSTGMEIDHQLLPHEGACLLRSTYRWTIPIRSRGVRKAAARWQAEVKAIAEREENAR